MAFVKRVCKICNHHTNSYSRCGRDECDKNVNNDNLPIREAIHDHCAEEDQHGLCTKVGCMAETVPLGLVNPPIDGSAPAPEPFPQPGDAVAVTGLRGGDALIGRVQEDGRTIEVVPEKPIVVAGPERGPNLGEIAEACRGFLAVYDDPFENDVSPFGSVIERLHDLIHSQLESQD